MQPTQLLEVRQEYGTAKGWRWFILLFAPPMILLFLAAPFLMWDKSPQWGAAIGFGVLGLAMALFFLYALLETIKARHIITADKLIYQGVLRRKELPLANIKGYRIDQQYTHLLPNNAQDPKIRIGYTSERYEALQQWFAARYPDLDVLEQEEDTARVLQEKELGRTVDEREAALAKGAKLAKAANIAGAAVAAWLFLQPEPYHWAVAAGLLLPLLATVVLWLNRGIIRPDEKKNSAYPSVTLVLLLPSLMLLVRGLLDFDILDYAPLWPQAAAVAVVWGLALLVASQPFIARNDSRFGLLTSVVLYAAIYGYAAVVAYNCAFDTSPATIYEVQVLSKHKTSGKTTTYHLQVSPWGPRTTPDDVTVTEDYYDHTTPGDTAQILQQAGQLDVPWFMVVE